MPVLISGGLSPEAYRLQRILNRVDVVFADETELPLFSKRLSLVLPAYRSTSFVHEMLKSCLDHGITHVYPLKRGEVVELSKARDLFSEYRVVLMIPSDNWLKNEQHVSAKGENITILEHGNFLAGEALIESDLLKNETGVFSWATGGQKTEYSLYLV